MEAWSYLIRGLALYRAAVSGHTMGVLAQLGGLLVLVGERLKAVEILHFTVRHRATSKTTANWAKSQLDEVAAHLPVIAFQAAYTRAEYLDLDTVITDLLQQEMPPSIVGTDNRTPLQEVRATYFRLSYTI